MRLVIARCSVDYTGRLNAHLPLATRLLVHKGDGSLLVHSDGGSYKPLNWMSPPCSLAVEEPDEDAASAGVIEQWRVTHAKTGDALLVRLYEVIHDSSHELGVDPGLQKDGVEADLQRLLAEQVGVIGEHLTLVRREFPTAIGPVDLMLRDPDAATVVALEDETPRALHVAVEVKRRAGIDAVEQLTRYLDLLNRDSHLRPVRGVLAAQAFAPQARTLATDRGIDCVVLDYEAMKGIDSGLPTLF
ncbi:endonuclease NucS [Microbacterium sp. BG28]|uniref:endonuclease NucS n=1 Tax=Microbacterium TaxID=33882 RepID=UPI001F16E4F2|nr:MULTISPECIES: endonuclease NucS [Microbacterium]MDY0828380.1 endonuclease NucS [Microbacterium sp. BG28]UIN30675.1 endonuclease NucS [Microbacterium binotii]